jgi:predicted transcriptional regulator YdeE
MPDWTAFQLVGMVLATFAGIGNVPALPRTVEQTGFTVVGISARTTNAREMAGQGVIGKQWGRFMQENLLSQIPNKVDSSILAVYTDYESDANGAYTFIIGARVNSAEKIPNGMMATKVPAGRYAVLTSDKGPPAKVVPETWGRVLAASKATLGGDRAYKADFEVYDQRAADPQNARIDLYIGLK